MGIIRTVSGDLQPENLGITHGHEHLIWAPPEPYQSEDPDLGLQDMDAAAQELTHFKLAGGSSLVEMTTVELGRDPQSLLRLTHQTGVRVIACTGFNKAKFSQAFVSSRDEEALAEIMVTDISEGMQDTAIRAGVIKVSTSLERATESERKVIRAAGRAHQVSAAPVSTHTQAGTFAHEQLDLLEEAGVPPERVLIGHMDRNLDPGLHISIAERGAHLGFDQIGKEKYASDEKRAEMMMEIIERGFGDRIVLGGDIARKSGWPSHGLGHGPGLTHIIWNFAPRLRRLGADEDVLRTLLIDNPAEFFQIPTPVP